MASKTPETKGTAAGAVPRLRSAALADARGAAPDKAAPLCLEAMSLPLCQDFFRQLEQAPELFEDPADLSPYTYDPAAAEAWFKARAGEADRRDFAILLEKTVIGALAFKHVDEAAHSAELEICLVNDKVKNRDHGTRAVALALEQGFGTLGLETVTAAVLKSNTRSRRVLQKNGFFLCGSEGAWQHYRLTREQYTRRKGEERT